MVPICPVSLVKTRILKSLLLFSYLVSVINFSNTDSYQVSTSYYNSVSKFFAIFGVCPTYISLVWIPIVRLWLLLTSGSLLEL